MSFFYAVHPRIYGYELLPSLVSAKKVTFGSKLVANEQDNCAVLTLSIRFLGWIEGFLDARLLIWHHCEDVIQLIHVHYIGLTMSVALLREGGKYYRECRLFKCFRDVSEMSIFGCHKTLTPPSPPPHYLPHVSSDNSRLHQRVLQVGKISSCK